jgi:uncharacterized membrane-anchored protein YjiN (DUF445 family)
MILNEQIIGLIFRILNTAAIVGALWYVFKNYVLDMITQRMRAKQRELADLSDHAQLVTQRVTSLSAEIAQDQQFDEMRDRIEQWRQVRQNQMMHRQREQLLREQYVREQYARRAEYLKSLYLTRQVVPQVAASMYQQLAGVFADERSGKKVIDKVVVFMKVNRS